MTVDELRAQLALLPGHYEVAIPMTELDIDGSVRAEDLKFAERAQVEGYSHVFVVIR